MPRHKQVTTCLRGGGPVSKFCSCEHCTLGVCSVCGAYEGSLTTDCPGEKVNFDKQREVYETSLDFSDKRGWHQGEPMEYRSPNFKPEPMRHMPLLAHEKIPRIAGCSCGWRTPHHVTDSDDAFAAHAAVAHAQREFWSRVGEGERRSRVGEGKLTKKAIAWVLADRIADDRSAVLSRAEDEAAEHVHPGQTPDDRGREMLAKLEAAKVDFHLADQYATKCDDEFRQVARELVAAMERDP